MKKIITIFLVTFSLTFLLSCDKEEVITERNIPAAIKTYITTHFPATAVHRAVKDRDGDELYEITLANGVTLEFNKLNEIIDIDANSKLPASVIPPPLLSYTSTNYPSNYIIGWELTGNNQEIKLNSNVELIFTMAGEFLRIDD